MEIITAHITDTFHTLPDKEEYLSSCELGRYEKISSEKRRREFLVGRYLLKKELAKRLKSKPDIQIDENGKPYVDGIHFNMSHSKDMFVLVFDDEEIGVDVEYINPKRNTDSLITVFEDSIIEEYNALPAADKLLFFYKHWTQKEAYIKLTQARFYTPASEDKSVQFQTHQLSSDYMVSIASYKLS